MKKLLIYILFFICSFISPSIAQSFVKDLKGSKGDPTEFSADTVIYDDKNKKIIAIGNVEAIHEGAILVSDRLEYDTQKDVIIAKDNVVISYSDGKTVFSDRVEVSSDFKKGIASKIIIKNSDGSSLTASDLLAREDEKIVMRDASYTPCDLCEGKPPSWRLSSTKATYDKSGEKISYQNATLDLFGTPMMYMPYFTHGNMNSDSKTGFLTPKFGSSGNLGAMLSTPFFVHINDNHKMTLTPTYLSKENPLFSGDYHGYTKYLGLNANGSYINQKDGEDRYFFNEKTTAHINENWRLRSDLNAISDETFLKVYDLPNEDEPWLMDSVNLDRFSHNSNLNVTYYYFKDLRQDIDNSTMPTVLPLVDYNYVSDPSKYGGYYNFKFNSAFLTRDETGFEHEQQYQRYTSMIDYNLPLNGKIGEKYKITASMRGDFYNLDNAVGSDGELYTGTKGRAYPELAFSSSYPFARTDNLSTQIIEPAVVFATSPNQKEKGDIPNEDSRDFELTESNILTTNRFSGYDKVETGTRANYGINWNIYGHEGYSFTAFMGQSYRFTDTNYFPEKSGLEEGFSDYIGVVNFYGSDFFNLDYSFRLNRDDLSFGRSELAMGLGNTFLRTNISYLYIEANSDSEYSDLEDREEINLGLSSNLTRYVKASAYTRYNLYTETTVENRFKIGYEDECIGISFLFKRDFTKDRDYKGDTSVMLTLDLKTVGTLRTGSLAVQ